MEDWRNSSAAASSLSPQKTQTFLPSSSSSSLFLSSSPRSSLPPPPLPPRAESRLRANVNVVSLSVGTLVDVSRASGLESFQSPVLCGKCSAALSCLSSMQKNVWVCEFCGCESAVSDRVCVGDRVCVSHRVCVDDIYLQNHCEDDYQNLEESLVVFCVDVSGSMSVTAEESPRRRVALVTFNDEVVIYGDGTSTPLTLRDWALVDYDHIWKQGVAYSIPHCIAETHQQLRQRVKEEHGATSLGPAALASVAMASRYPGSKVVLCTDGRANIGLGEMEKPPSLSSLSPSSLTPYFYKQLAQQAVESGYFPFEDEQNHTLVREIGNVTKGLEVTFQFAVKPEFMEVFLQKDTLPFQLQLSFKTRDQEKTLSDEAAKVMYQMKRASSVCNNNNNNNNNTTTAATLFRGRKRP
ncbi:hypothetical protein F7725_004902 [Dissostichus mawsoni]|uniref:Uncharacterized protein n=1 Tax=Dissostichus mawsoni TaxID=36200 RepID=A0A7J5XMR1_DISMA|nr:hypothetical protein F7725_004902 [Dissostichus mawsoni]